MPNLFRHPTSLVVHNSNPPGEILKQVQDAPMSFV